MKCSSSWLQEKIEKIRTERKLIQKRLIIIITTTTTTTTSSVLPPHHLSSGWELKDRQARFHKKKNK